MGFNNIKGTAADDKKPIHPCHTVAILSQETKKALFYHAKPHSGNHGGEAWRGKTKLFWSPGTIWPLCDKGE